MLKYVVKVLKEIRVPITIGITISSISLTDFCIGDLVLTTGNIARILIALLCCNIWALIITWSDKYEDE